MDLKSTLLASIIIGASIIVSSQIVSNNLKFEMNDKGEVLDKSTGTIYKSEGQSTTTIRGPSNTETVTERHEWTKKSGPFEKDSVIID